jgi:uncharacterized membrane protein
MKILKDLTELVNADVISSDTAEKIKAYYIQKESKSQNKLFVVFGVLGSLLIGLGIMLIIAHNWDELPVFIKTVLAFIPLVTGQLLCAFTLFKKKDSVAWKEATAVFLFIAVGACISLISQIYNIPGDINSYTLTWMLLCLPLVYIMDSSIVSLFYIVGISYYNTSTNYWGYHENNNYWYWLLLLAIVPHYYILIKKNVENNFLSFHHWMIAISLIISLGSIAKSNEEIMVLSYMSLFGLFYNIGNHSYFENKKTINNSYLLSGALGIFIMLIGLSFNWFWKYLLKETFVFLPVISSPEFISFIVISILATVILYFSIIKKSIHSIHPYAIIYILFIVLFIIGNYIPYIQILINILLLTLGTYTVWDGTRKNHLGILNFGLLIISSLVIARFFDTNISFVIRGMMFVLVGIGFLVTNLWMLKKRKAHEKN